MAFTALDTITLGQKIRRAWGNLVKANFDDHESRVADLETVATAIVVPSYVTLGATATLTNERVLTAGGGIALTDAGAGSTITVAATAAVRTRTISLEIDGGGSVISTGAKGWRRIPFTGTITKATLLADQSGSIVVDVWKDTYANFPPTDADSITAAAPPTLSAAIKSEDTTLTGWTTSVTAGDVIRFNVDSAATLTRVTLDLEVTI